MAEEARAEERHEMAARRRAQALQATDSPYGQPL